MRLIHAQKRLLLKANSRINVKLLKIARGKRKSSENIQQLLKEKKININLLNL